MTNEGGTNHVTLRVEFSGLCLYLIHDPSKTEAEAEDPRVPNAGEARNFVVVMPDARKKVNPILEDDTRAEAHVGYVRFDLANLDTECHFGIEPGVVEDDVGRPRNEIIHRLDGEFLDFGIGSEPDAVNYDLAVPSFNKFADRLEPIADCFNGQNPSKGLLMRTALRGGKITAAGSGKIWAFSSILASRTHSPPYANQFGGYAVWNRRINTDKLKVTIRKFNGTGETTIPLKAVRVTDLDGVPRDMITIKVSNLCAHNPMEWRDDYPTRTAAREDTDFKWLYRLLKPKGGKTYAALLDGCPLPVPKEIRVQTFGDEDCMGGSYTKTP